MKIFGIEFAPFFIPLERRIQTFAVFQLTLSFLCLGFGCTILWVYFLFTSYYYISIIYLVWYYYDFNKSEQGGRRWEFMRRWTIFKYFVDYFPIKLIKSAELDPGKNYIFGYHPHGIMSAGAFSNFGTEATGFSKLFPNIRPYLMTLAGQFRFPFYREFIMCSGACSVSKASIEWLLTKEGPGNAVVIVVGGALEALEANPGKFTLKLRSRKGFIKLALKHGASLVPVFSFGENDLFIQVPNPDGSMLKTIQLKITKFFGVSPPQFHGRGVFNYNYGLVPFRRTINTVVGAPIDVARNDYPSDQDIEELHARYVDALKMLFENHKLQYGIEDIKHLKIE